jgi:hypothetical protein
MGAKLVKYYELIGEKAGLQGRMRLAMKTNVPSTKAQEAPDTSETLAKAYEVAKEILGAQAPRL